MDPYVIELISKSENIFTEALDPTPWALEPLQSPFLPFLNDELMPRKLSTLFPRPTSIQLHPHRQGKIPNRLVCGQCAFRCRRRGCVEIYGGK
jgi:hypothetical protein